MQVMQILTLKFKNKIVAIKLPHSKSNKRTANTVIWRNKYSGDIVLLMYFGLLGCVHMVLICNCVYVYEIVAFNVPIVTTCYYNCFC